ncbi:MAG TPA: hypothetical protein ENH94_07835, partial [Phycisphaerales bacterium]|nr:hypothetical protein [Phycisphaerales bacterium]
MKDYKLIFQFIISIAIILFCSSVTFAVHGEGPEPDLPEFEPNEIIVKFKEPIAATIENQLETQTLAGPLTFSHELDQLNARYRVQKIRPIFKNFKKNRQRIKDLRLKNRSLLTKKEKHILRRLKRAPKNAPVPDLGRVYKIKADLQAGQNLEDMKAQYANSPDVEYAELNYIVSADKTPNDPYYPVQWALNNTGQWYQESGKYNHQPGSADSDIDAPQAWDIHTGSGEVIVAVVDSGVDYRHRDIVNNMWADSNGYYGRDYVNDDNDPMDDYGHGTHSAGIIAADSNNGLDITGTSWNTKIMALKFLNSSGNGDSADAATAFYYAVDNGADIISNSWGGGDYLQSLQDAIDYAHSQGVVVIASAGNDDTNTAPYPADYNHVISVAATDSNDDKASFSNYGDWVDIAAPGVDILSLRTELYALGMIYDNYTTILSGTSMACPYVAGAAAMLLAIDPTLSPEKIETVLEGSADTIDPAICASGRLNLYNAIQTLVDSNEIIQLDRTAYSCTGDIEIKLFDSDLAGNGTQDVNISTDGGDLETVTLNELTTAGVFKGSIVIDSGTVDVSDGSLQVSEGGVITASYGNASDIADVDCSPPIISNVQIDAAGPMVRVTFDTNEVTTAKVRAGLTCGDHSITATDPIPRTSHEVLLRFLEPGTDHYFVIDVKDSAGNVTTDSNSGACYSFTTVAPLRVPSVYATIQAAIDDANDGDTVLVADGNYTGDGNRDIEFGGKSITVKSENGPENCIIDCNGSEEDRHRGFDFVNRECWRAKLDGFTVTNGMTNRGGGIRCDLGSSPTITNCRITGNDTTSTNDLGGGMLLHDPGSSPTITNCVISNNTASFQGGGIYIEWYNNPIISNCIIAENAIVGESANVGGGVLLANNSSMIMTNCIIKDNHSDSHAAGIGIGTNDTTCAHISNCVITGNSAVNKGGGIKCGRSKSIFENCIVWGNTAAIGPNIQINGGIVGQAWVDISYCDIEGGQAGIDMENNYTLEWGSGNIESDPCFVDVDANDFHLRWDSP